MIRKEWVVTVMTDDQLRSSMSHVLGYLFKDGVEAQLAPEVVWRAKRARARARARLWVWVWGGGGVGGGKIQRHTQTEI